MATEQLDVLIIGAGLSGIGAACHLIKDCPNKSYAILEGRESMGGTWDLFKYPGIRSDSDMYTLGYNFKPWTNPKAIADGPSILSYIKETATENGVDKNIRYGQMVKKVDWDSATSTWTTYFEDKKSGEMKQIRSSYLLSCTGYYNYKAGYEPEFKGKEDFKGQVIHPQQWPEDLDYSGKRVVVIGSGATAVTLVPAMTDKAAHVTMLQRSPTYMASLPAEDALLNNMRKYLPDTWVYRFARTRNVMFGLGMFNFSKRYPERTRKFLLSMVKKQLNGATDMKHFSPDYNPWEERLCAVTDGDLFKAIRKDKASVVTDHIDHFTESGIKLQSGEELQADIIITATGLDIQLLGGTEIFVDGQSIKVNEKMCYKGTMLEDLPNAAFVFGYTNASWTLKADLVSEYFCRMINHMDRIGKTQFTPRNLDSTIENLPFIDMQSGYIQRALDRVPKQGSRLPWRLYQNYAKDMAMFRFGKIDDGVMEFSNGKSSSDSRSSAQPSLST